MDDICASWSPASREARGLAEQSQALPEAQPVLIMSMGFPRASAMLKVMQTTTTHTVSPTARHGAEHKAVKYVRIISLGSEPELGTATRVERLPAAPQVSRKEVEVPRQARKGRTQERQNAGKASHG